MDAPQGSPLHQAQHAAPMRIPRATQRATCGDAAAYGPRLRRFGHRGVEDVDLAVEAELMDAPLEPQRLRAEKAVVDWMDWISLLGCGLVGGLLMGLVNELDGD